MTAERKRWWRMAVIAAVSGCVITGGWYGLVRAKGPSGKEDGESTKWTRSVVTPPSAPVAQVERGAEAAPAPATAPVTPASAALPIPPTPSAPALPEVPVIPSAPDPAPLTLPPAVDPVAAPKLPDLPAPSGVRPATAAIPPLPSIPPAELPPLPTPPLPTPPKTPDAKAPDSKPMLPPVPELPAPGALTPPSLPDTKKTEPPKPITSPAPLPAPKPVLPDVPAPPGILPPPQPVQPPTLPQPTPPAKSDSDLNPNKGGNTLNPAAPPVPPIAPIPPLPPIGGDKTGTQGTPVDRAKPTDPSGGSSDKFVFPVPDPIVPPHRDDTMMKITTAASFAILSGAMLAAEKAAALPIPAAPKVPTPGTLVKAEKTDVEKLKDDLTKANEKIADLEKQVKKLTELLTGKKDDQGPIPTEPGAVAEIARLKDRIKTLEDEIKTLKTQTALKPSTTIPEVKPKGTVKVVNEYPVEISIVVNDKSYRVAPNTKLDVEVPAGDFTYQLLQAGAAVTRSTIKEKETVTLRIK